MKEKDWVVIPQQGQGTIAIAEFLSPYQHECIGDEILGQSVDSRNDLSSC